MVTPADFVEVDVDWHFDDVLLAPAGTAELQTRLRLAIARRRCALEGTLEFGDLVLHPARYSASLRGTDLGLTLTEFKLLNFLVQHAGQAFSRTRLMHEVWGLTAPAASARSTFTCDDYAPNSEPSTNRWSTPSAAWATWR